MKDKRQLEKTVHRCRDTRTNCQARMVVSKMKSGLWTIKSFGDAHNHDLLTSPSKMMKIRSHRHISDTCRSLMEALHKSKVGLSQMSRILNETLSNTGSAQITREDCSNHLTAVRSNNIGQECMAIVKFFKEKKLNDDFFSLIWILMSSARLDLFFGQMEDVEWHILNLEMLLFFIPLIKRIDFASPLLLLLESIIISNQFYLVVL
ncbi:FHY3/FAR1 family protein [Dioscorea alata]|uniref:FHY3/FAR1 family protein n=1 Tax=Dioscorea alata TaxID=55571 RepID=A0ACB7USB3_DIOAL|nr:FHY3/FAR1 family protein [Dioscorea alata]